MSDKNESIRNFCIIAHIDHGKSTLADRILEITGSVDKREMSEQILDNMELEKERGITIKSRAVTLSYNDKNNKKYIFNLIDTPGHVDFNYEVSRSLAACDGALLVVDATQGVEAQTLANTYLAVDMNLDIIPVINKIDLPSANTEKVIKEIEDVIGIPAQDALKISAKTGENVDEVLEQIVYRISSPQGSKNAKLKALIFDSFYDTYRGVVIHVRIKEGELKINDDILFMSSGVKYSIIECGHMLPTKLETTQYLTTGEVGYIIAGIKNIHEAKVGDTITLANEQALEPLPGYKNVVPMVFCGLYPLVSSKFSFLKDALEKLKLSDAALTFESETSVALGFGFRCGFLGLLHAEIIQERIWREFNLDLVITIPSVVYKIEKNDGQTIFIDNPSNYPDESQIRFAYEPIANANIYTPTEFIGTIMEFCQERRGKLIDIKYINEQRANINYVLPLNEIIYDFFDSLKSKTKGYASFDYEVTNYEKSDLVKLGIMIAGEPVDALSTIIHKSKACIRGRKIVEKLKDEIPRQQFEVPIQACLGSKIIARETVKAFRKDVTAKLYGGDVTRKKKLLEKQKEGKKRLRKFGKVEIPQSAFLAALKLGE